MRKLMGALGALAVAAAGLVAATPPAQGSVYLGIYAIKALGTNLCAGDSADDLWMSSCDPRHNIAQQWDVTAPPNTRTFSNRGWINDCLDDSILGLRATTCNGSSYQRFTLVVQSDGSTELKNLNTQNCATLGSGTLYASPCRVLRSQRFVLVKL